VAGTGGPHPYAIPVRAEGAGPSHQPHTPACQVLDHRAIAWAAAA
jgi:hypothetical protein